MEIQYKLSGRIIKGGKITAYKIYAGFYIFFISSHVFKEALDRGLICSEIDSSSLKDITYQEMLLERGETAASRLEQALKNSTVGYLQEALETTREMHRIYVLDFKYLCFILATVRFDINNDEVAIEIFEGLRGPVFDMHYTHLRKASKSHIGMLDFICQFQDIAYMNTNNLVRRTKYSNHNQYNPSQFKIVFR